MKVFIFCTALVLIVVFLISLNKNKKRENSSYECKICDDNDCICEKKEEDL